MERFDISNDARWSELVDAAHHGDDVIIVRHGEEVARLSPIVVTGGSATGRKVDLAGLHALRARFAHLRVPDTGALIRQMREDDDL